jgi:hypothetical protein
MSDWMPLDTKVALIILIVLQIVMLNSLILLNPHVTLLNNRVCKPLRFAPSLHTHPKFTPS